MNITALNSTTTVGNEPTYIRIISGVVIGILLLSGLFVNISMIALFSIKSHIRSPSNILLANLSMSNLIICVLMPITLSNIVDERNKLEGTSCEIFGLFSQLWLNGCIYTLAFISYDNCKLISSPFIYPITMTDGKAYTYVMITWTIAAILSLLPMFGWSRYTFNNEQYSCGVDLANNGYYNIFMLTFTFTIPCLIVMFCSTIITLDARGRVQPLRIIRRRPNLYEHSTRRNSLYKTIKKSLIVIVTFLIAWFPHVMFIYGPYNSKIKIISIFMYVPVLVYPYLFGFRNEKIKKELNKLFYEILYWRDVRQIHPAQHIDERDYSENVSRRNSRSESLNGADMGRLSRQRSSLFNNSRTASVGLVTVNM